jgi:hypothetical protein
MKIVLINAAAPDYSRKKRYSPSAFAEASVAFAATELKEGTISEAKLDGYHIWHASSPRPTDRRYVDRNKHSRKVAWNPFSGEKNFS